MYVSFGSRWWTLILKLIGYEKDMATWFLVRDFCMAIQGEFDMSTNNKEL